jgi:hypothetical protein
MHYMQFHREGVFDGALIGEDTIVSYEDDDVPVIEAAAALSNSSPGESAWPIGAEKVDETLLMTFDRAKTLGVIPRHLVTARAPD